MNNFAFFGTSRFSKIILGKLKNDYNMTPSLLVTTPDKPVGRKQIITSPETKLWALSNNIDIYQPPKLKENEVIEKLKIFDFFVVASYGKIIPQSILDLVPNKSINVHPSLLPLYRGPSPIQNQILNAEKNVGITIMLMDSEMDHGNILNQKNISFDDPCLGIYEEVEEKLAIESANLLFQTIENFIGKKNIESREQYHSKATFTKMIKKEDGEIKLTNDPEINYRKYLAYHEWPKVFYFEDKDGVKKRNIITEAKLEDGQFKIIKIIPEGKKETLFHSPE